MSSHDIKAGSVRDRLSGKSRSQSGHKVVAFMVLSNGQTTEYMDYCWSPFDVKFVLEMLDTLVIEHDYRLGCTIALVVDTSDGGKACAYKTCADHYHDAVRCALSECEAAWACIRQAASR